MEKVNDERDILKQYLQKVFRIDYSIKENDIVKSLGTKISLISNECSLPLDIRSLFIPPNNSDVIPQIIWHIQDIEYLSVSSQLLAKIYKINKLKELKVLVINQGNFKVPDNFILNNLELISTEKELFFRPMNFPSLKAIRCKYNDKILDELIFVKKIVSVAFNSVNTNIFSKINNIIGLKSLYINRGRLSNICDISCIKSLQKLSLMNLSKLNDLYPIVELKELKELQIGYCNHIHQWDFLLELEQLKYLSIPFSSTKYMPSEKILSSLRDKGVIII